MAIHKGARDTTALVSLILALAVLIIANLVADRGFLRVDLTDGGRYSLSEPFRHIVGRLEAPAKLTYYVSGTVPIWFEQVKVLKCGSEYLKIEDYMFWRRFY